MATDVSSAPSRPGPDHLDLLLLAERRRRLLRPPAPRVEERPPAPDRCEASAAGEGAGGAARQSWPGLPRGTQFNPSDSDLLWHLAAEVGDGHACRHPFISEFIKSTDDDIGFSCTHPQDIPGITNDGRASYFFHRSFNVYNNESDKCISWQKSGTPTSIIVDGDLQGCKEVFILYAYETNESNPQRTDWRLHQYHIKNTMKDAGELVVSKIFHESHKSHFQLAGKAHAQPAQDASAIDGDSKEQLQLENHYANRAIESNGNIQEQMEVETCVDENKLSSCNAVVDSPNANNGDQIINNHGETDDLDHISLQERYRILLADKRNHEGAIFRDDICGMLQEITSGPPIIDSMDDDIDQRLLDEGPSDNQQTHETGCDLGFLSMSLPAAPSRCQVGCSNDPSVNVNALVCSTDQTLHQKATCGDENAQLEARNHGTFLADVKLEPSLEGDLAGKTTFSEQSVDPKHVTDGCSLAVSSDICKRTHTLNQDGGLAYCSQQRKRRKIARDPDEKVPEEDSYIKEDATAYFSRRRRKRKTATDSIETALEEDAPGLLQILLDKGIMVKEIKLYGVEEDDEMIPDCEESDFQELENVISKLFPQRSSLLKCVARHTKGEKAIYCLACLISLIEQSRYLQFRDCPVEWGWCRDLQSFIFVFKSHNRIVLERPEYGYATYFFEIVQSLPIEWQIRRLVTAMKLSNCGRTALIENRPLLVGEDLTEGEALVLEEYGWIPNSGLGTMLNYRDRVVHDRWNEKSSTDWRVKIGKLLVHGYSEGQLVTTHIPKKVGKLLDDINEDAEIKLEDPY